MDAPVEDVYVTSYESVDDDREPSTGSTSIPRLHIRYGSQTPVYVGMELQAGMQSLRGSDFAASTAARFSAGPLTMSGAATAYFETLPNGDQLSFNTWRVGAGYRYLVDNRAELFVEVGPTGASSEGLDLFGGVASVGGRIALSDAVGIDGALRGYSYTDNILAAEASAGLRLSFLRIGYRWRKFDIGPALEGPELGLSFGF